MKHSTAYNYLLSLANLPRREYISDPKHCVIYLRRLQVLLDIMKNPEKKIPHYIHITGTSGKGSTALMLSSILKKGGKKVGTITSPHPSDITERWEINEKEKNKKKFVKLIEYIKPKLDQYLQKTKLEIPSFFEIITALGLQYFADENVDWAILEVGLGGRYDSTNVIPNKDICVITNIGDDHKNIIGPTKKEIAYEKSGIIKKGCTIFTSEKNKGLLSIIQNEVIKTKAKKLNIINSKKYKILIQNTKEIKFEHSNNTYSLPLLGAHQIGNAILAIEIAKKIGITENKIKKGLQSIELPLRMEIINNDPIFIVDGAHNVDKIKSTIQTLNSTQDLKKKKINLILGFSNDKEWPKMIKQILTLKPKTVACTRFTNNTFRTTADPREIQKQFPNTVKTAMFLDPQKAYEWSRKQTKKDEIILVTGSFFLSGQLRSKSNT